MQKNTGKDLRSAQTPERTGSQTSCEANAKGGCRAQLDKKRAPVNRWQSSSSSCKARPYYLTICFIFCLVLTWFYESNALMDHSHEPWNRADTSHFPQKNTFFPNQVLSKYQNIFLQSFWVGCQRFGSIGASLFDLIMYLWRIMKSFVKVLFSLDSWTWVGEKLWFEIYHFYNSTKDEKWHYMGAEWSLKYDPNIMLGRFV